MQHYTDRSIVIVGCSARECGFYQLRSVISSVYLGEKHSGARGDAVHLAIALIDCCSHAFVERACVYKVKWQSKSKNLVFIFNEIIEKKKKFMDFICIITVTALLVLYSTAGNMSYRIIYTALSTKSILSYPFRVLKLFYQFSNRI